MRICENVDHNPPPLPPTFQSAHLHISVVCICIFIPLEFNLKDNIRFVMHFYILLANQLECLKKITAFCVFYLLNNYTKKV